MNEQMICEQLAEVRADGGTNMMSMRGVQHIVDVLGLFELGDWIDSDPDSYIPFLMGDVFADYLANDA